MREGFHGESNVYEPARVLWTFFRPSIFLTSGEWGWRQTKICRENTMFDVDGLMLQSFPCLKTLSTALVAVNSSCRMIYRCKQTAIASNATQIANWISLTHALERCCSSRWRSKFKHGENHMRTLSYSSSCPLTHMYFEARVENCWQAWWNEKSWLSSLTKHCWALNRSLVKFAAIFCPHFPGRVARPFAWKSSELHASRWTVISVNLKVLRNLCPS